jgi:hypothetical protein
MQPYQESSEEIRRQQSAPANFLRKGTSAALALTGTTAIASRIAPFLSKYIPQDLAMKGLSKISPRIGNFLSNSLANGYSFDDVKNFIGNKIEKKQEPIKDNRNIIEQYSPELNQFIKDQMQKGQSPLGAGAIAQNSKKFSDIIKKMMKDHKTPWSDIIQSIFGNGQTVQSNQMPSQEPEQQPQQQNQSGVDPELSQLLQQGNAILQRFRGS